jgi:LuxR family maltose regulon positive regulatory protein
MAGAGESGGLLATKLFAPRPRPGFVARPRLVQGLDDGLARGLVLVSAPAGFGKTSLLADWALRRPVAWLSLDAGDNDPVRFWRHATAALDRVRPGIAERVIPLLGPPPSSFEGLVTALINQLAAEPDQGQVVLVLDDYHVIDARAVHASLTFLLEHRPPALRLVVTGRADPPLPLPRLRARGQLAELRAAELRFTTVEAAALLREAVGSDLALPDGAVAALAARTEGWAAGLQLTALSLQGRAEVAGFVASFSAGHRYVMDYLAEEVLERQAEPVRAFLLETSILERLSGPLCDAVRGRGDSQAMLEQAERANLFLVPLDEVRGWWRYHQLFAELLRARLHRRRPDRVAALHRNAAGWSERNGLPDDAIRHAFAAGDAAWAARLIEREVDALLLRGERGTLERWLAALPAELVSSRPRLLLAQAELASAAGRLEAVERALDAAERAFASAPDAPYEPSVPRAVSLVANVPAAIASWRAYLAELGGDADRAITFERQALAALGEAESVLASVARLHLRAAELLRGNLAEAERAFASSMAEFRTAGESYLALRACELLGHVQRAQGRLDAALATYRQGLDIAAAPGRPPLPAAGIAHVGLAEVAYQRGELDAAREHATEGIALCRRLAYPRPLAAGLATLARIRRAEGDLSGALDILDEYRQWAPSRGLTGLFDPIPALRARLLLAQGDLASAARWIKERGLGDDEVRYPWEPGYLVLARLLLAQDLPDQALMVLDRLEALAATQGRTGSVIEIQALRAVTLAAAGEPAGAVATLAETLTLASPQGYVRVFADEGPPMAALVRGLLAGQRARQPAAVPRDYLARLAAAFEQAGTPVLPAARRGVVVVPGLVEPLSSRELEVLELLAAGLPNRAIAEELVVTLDTVKSHVSRLLDKLAVANRTQAVTRARELGLVR